MKNKEKTYDVIIIGAGPCGLAAGIDAKQLGLDYLIIDKGNITESIRRYPRNMTFFSTSEMIEIGKIPFTSLDIRPSRTEALKYYRKVVKHFDLTLQLYTSVHSIEQKDDHFILLTDKGELYCEKVVLAIGYYDIPRQLNIPGEELPHVSHYYDEPFRYTKMKVVVVGGANSAIETMLDLYRNDVDVSLVHQYSDFDKTAKYWIVPDAVNRVKKGEVKAYFNSVVEKIDEEYLCIRNTTNGEREKIPADFVFLMVGYRPDADFMQKIGIKLNGKAFIPEVDPESYESNIPGIYLAGSVIGGEETAKIFIENGRHHGAHIMADIAQKKKEKVGS